MRRSENGLYTFKMSTYEVKVEFEHGDECDGEREIVLKIDDEQSRWRQE